VLIESTDYGENHLRLKEFADFDISGNLANFVSQERSDTRKIIHWASVDTSSKATLKMVANSEIIEIEGVLEHHSLSKGDIVQIERIGYGVIGEHNTIIFTHD
jgi:hypothetical protein